MSVNRETRMVRAILIFGILSFSKIVYADCGFNCIGQHGLCLKIVTGDFDVARSTNTFIFNAGTDMELSNDECRLDSPNETYFFYQPGYIWVDNLTPTIRVKDRSNDDGVIIEEITATHRNNFKMICTSFTPKTRLNVCSDNREFIWIDNRSPFTCPGVSVSANFGNCAYNKVSVADRFIRSLLQSSGGKIYL